MSHSDQGIGAGLTGLHVHVAHLSVVVSEGGGTDTGQSFDYYHVTTWRLNKQQHLNYFKGFIFRCLI